MASPRVYSTLSKIGYPLFSSKLAEVKGREHLPKTGGYIVAANHVDWLDGFFIATAVGQARNTRVYFLTKSNYYWWTTAIIPIPKRKGAIIDQTVHHLHRGKVIVIFPEGQRNPTSKLWPGKTGVIRMAMAAEVPVVPLGITCTYGRNVGQSLVNLMSKNHPVKIQIGQPLHFEHPTESMTNDLLHEQTSRLMKSIAPLCHKTI